MSLHEQQISDHPLVSTTVLVVGGGATARAVAAALSHRGCGVILLDPEGDLARTTHNVVPDEGVEIWSPASLVSFDGFPGAFHVMARLENGRHVEADAGAVILAPEGSFADPYAAWGLAESGTVRSLSRLEERLYGGAKGTEPYAGNGLTHVLISGFTHTPHPISQKRGMEAAIRLAAKDKGRVFFLLEHFKVADSGLERLARQAREAGVLFAKSNSAPVIEMTGGRMRVSFDDDALGERVSLHPDRIVLEEALEPASFTGPMAALLGIHTGPGGFFQGDNVNNQPIYTNRIGIWVVGRARGPVSDKQGLKEADAAVHEATRLLNREEPFYPAETVRLDT
ncbi:MAG: hypothetical protein JRJ60_09160, partial [Deltaproteobacteria bacterium]|nr:hypothetical protein [Deltaproteobacteria bacterium]